MLPPPNSPLSRLATPSSTTMPPPTTRATLGRVRSTATARIAAIGGTREAFTAGMSEATTVTRIPTTRLTMIVPGFTTVPPAGMSMPSAASRALSPEANPMPASSPMHRRHHPDRERLEEDAERDLHPAGADRPQQGVLAQSLRDRDGERVVDHERAHDQGHDGEHQQELAEEAEAPLEAVLSLLHHRRAADHLDLRNPGQRRTDPLHEDASGKPRRQPRSGWRRSSPAGPAASRPRAR